MKQASSEEKEVMQIDHFRLLLLNIGKALHDGDWNWQGVASPFARIYYVTRGEAKILMYGKSFDLRPGHIYYIPAFALHSYQCDGVFEHFYIHVYEDQYPVGSLLDHYDMPIEEVASEFDCSLIQRLYELNPSMQLPQSDPSSYDNRQTLLASVHRNKQRSLSTRLESRGILYQLVSRFLLNAKPKYTSGDYRVHDALAEINNHMHLPITVEDLSKQACLSKDHFIRLFKKEIGESPLQYINRKKIERAQLMLVTGSDQIKTIAYKLGFDDNSYFIRIFKKYVKMSPTEYRKSYL